MFSELLNIGVVNSMPNQMVRQIKLTNMIILILIGFGTVLFVPVLIDDGFNSTALIVLVSILLMLALLVLNKKNFINITRLILSFYAPLMIILATTLTKVLKPENVVDFDFVDARCLLVAVVVIPFLLFSYKEKWSLVAALSFPFLLVILFDPIHNMLGIGYKDFFGNIPNYYIVTGIYIDVALIFIAGSVYYFKANIESLLQRNYSLTDDLGEKNKELSKLFEDLEYSNEGLRKNESVVKNQKALLEKSNSILAKEVESKTNELRQSNEELVKHNNELQQFSNTLSHNLRGPVANLLGLSLLFKMDNSEENRANVADHIFKSAEALDGVIKDLNKVVELRNNLFQIKEKIDIKKEIDDIWLVLENSVLQSRGNLILDIQDPLIYGVRSYFHSIMYNLISNAIKYRHQDRECIIRIKTIEKENHCLITIQDNGLGIDTQKHGNKLFGMYKRFHDHLEGKGLGLFLTKQQVEAMKGSISVESEPNIGARFTLKLPSIPLSQIKSQLFYQSEVADIYLDAVNNITTLLWKKMPDSVEFKDVFTNNIGVFNSYNSSKWIIDLSLMFNRSEQEKQWILDVAIDQYVQVGIEKIALVRTYVDEDKEFWEEFNTTTVQKSLDVLFAKTITEAKEILLDV